VELKLLFLWVNQIDLKKKEKGKKEIEKKKSFKN